MKSSSPYTGSRRRQAAYEGVDTRRRNSYLKDLAERARSEREQATKPKYEVQSLGCSVLCHGKNHTEKCPNVIHCQYCGHYEFNRYEGQCLNCGRL
jgi:hypothetical protein